MNKYNDYHESETTEELKCTPNESFILFIFAFMVAVNIGAMWVIWVING